MILGGKLIHRHLLLIRSKLRLNLLHFHRLLYTLIIKWWHSWHRRHHRKLRHKHIWTTHWRRNHWILTNLCISIFSKFTKLKDLFLNLFLWVRCFFLGVSWFSLFLFIICFFVAFSFGFYFFMFFSHQFLFPLNLIHLLPQSHNFFLKYFCFIFIIFIVW